MAGEVGRYYIQSVRAPQVHLIGRIETTTFLTEAAISVFGSSLIVPLSLLVVS
jgi:hypothetical protein